MAKPSSSLSMFVRIVKREIANPREEDKVRKLDAQGNGGSGDKHKLDTNSEVVGGDAGGGRRSSAGTCHSLRRHDGGTAGDSLRGR